jgi:hypothetical protein
MSREARIVNSSSWIEEIVVKRFLLGMVTILASGVCLLSATAMAQQTLVIKSLAELKVTSLPAGPLFWRIENFATLVEAQAVAGPTGLPFEYDGKVWLFKLGPAGGSSLGATKVADVGPISPVVATQYLLRINEASGPPGSVTAVHTHPGSEAFYVLSGEQTIRTPKGTLRVTAGRPETGQGADVPMQVSSSGATDLRALVMFVVDANKAFSTPAKFP